MVYINVPNMNDSVSSLTIDNTGYKLRFTYNGTYDYWSVRLQDMDGDLDVVTRVVPNYPLFIWYRHAKMPDGIFAALTNKDTIGRDSFRNLDAEFVYIPRSDLEEE